MIWFRDRRDLFRPAAGGRNLPGRWFRRTRAIGRIRNRPGRWIVFYDDDCGLCKWLLSGILRWDRGRVLEPVPLQDRLAERLLGDLPFAQRMASWHLVSPTGERRSAGAAVAPMVALLPHGRWLSVGLARIPWLVEPGYRWVAAHRTGLSRFVPSGWKRAGAELVEERLKGLG